MHQHTWLHKIMGFLTDDDTEMIMLTLLSRWSKINLPAHHLPTICMEVIEHRLTSVQMMFRPLLRVSVPQALKRYKKQHRLNKNTREPNRITCHLTTRTLSGWHILQAHYISHIRQHQSCSDVCQRETSKQQTNILCFQICATHEQNVYCLNTHSQVNKCSGWGPSYWIVEKMKFKASGVSWKEWGNKHQCMQRVPPNHWQLHIHSALLRETDKSTD